LPHPHLHRDFDPTLEAYKSSSLRPPSSIGYYLSQSCRINPKEGLCSAIRIGQLVIDFAFQISDESIINYAGA
jgi:hypothetical protein